MNIQIDTDTHCPVCGFENVAYREGRTSDRYDGCEDEYSEYAERDAAAYFYDADGHAGRGGNE